MGWRLRKSVGIGKLFRLNLSKSGLGFSLGIPGFRVSVGPDKKVRRTVGLPGTGIYNTEVIGDLRGNNPAGNRRVCPTCGRTVGRTVNYCPNCGERL